MRKLALNLPFFDYNGFKKWLLKMLEKNGLKSKIKKITAQKEKFFWGTKVLLQEVLFKINLNTKEFKEDYIEQKDLTL